MKRVVVTGAASSIGIAVIEQCIIYGIEVLALVRKNSAKTAFIPNSELVRVESCELEEMKFYKSGEKEYDVFYHFAWADTDKIGRFSPELQQKNITYSLDALELAERLGCKKFIGAGSQAEYGIHTEKITGPKTPVNPYMAYGICKYTSGKLLSIAARQKNMDFFWVRIFSVYGYFEAETTMISSTINKMLRGQHCSFTKGEHIWDYLFTEDAGRALFLIGLKCRGNRIYCLGSGKGRPLNEFIEEIRDVVSPKAELGLGEIPYQEGTAYGMCADISDLTADTGFSPTVSFKEGIMRMVNG